LVYTPSITELNYLKSVNQYECIQTKATWDNTTIPQVAITFPGQTVNHLWDNLMTIEPDYAQRGNNIFFANTDHSEILSYNPVSLRV
jgi:hypothetical protein